MQENFVIYNEEYVLIKGVLGELKRNTKAQTVFITDSEGHCIASTGDMDDSYLNSVSSLIAGSIAAVNGIAKMLDIDDFASVLAESGDKSIHVSLINERVMLVVVFDSSSNLGLVRFRVKSALGELQQIFVTINEKLDANVFEPEEAPFEGVTDEDIDEIFGD